MEKDEIITNESDKIITNESDEIPVQEMFPLAIFDKIYELCHDTRTLESLASTCKIINMLAWKPFDRKIYIMIEWSKESWNDERESYKWWFKAFRKGETSSGCCNKDSTRRTRNEQSNNIFGKLENTYEFDEVSKKLLGILQMTDTAELTKKMVENWSDPLVKFSFEDFSIKVHVDDQFLAYTFTTEEPDYFTTDVHHEQNQKLAWRKITTNFNLANLGCD